MKESTMQKFKLAGILLTTGIFIVAMVSVSIAANSFFIRATNARLDSTNTRLDKLEIEVKGINLKLDQLLERLPKKD